MQTAMPQNQPTKRKIMLMPRSAPTTTSTFATLTTPNSVPVNSATSSRYARKRMKVARADPPAHGGVAQGVTFAVAGRNLSALCEGSGVAMVGCRE